MSLLKYIRIIERLDYLIARKATGTPRELAERLQISERQVYKYIKELKELGFPVAYCLNAQSYIYYKKGRIEITFSNEVNKKVEFNTTEK